MTDPVRHPLTMNGRDPSLLRGDRIDGDRYWSTAFAQKEWDRLWTRIWHVAGRTEGAAMLNAICYTVRDAVTLAVHFNTGDYWRNRLQGPISTAMVRNDIAHNMHHRAQIMFLMERLGLTDHIEGDLLTWESTSFGWR